MKDLLGTPGTISGLLLRMGQCLFAAGSIAAMVTATGFSSYTAFCFSKEDVLGFQLFDCFNGPSSVVEPRLACLDAYALRIKRDLQNPVLVSLFVVGDWVTAILSLAAACSSAGVTVLYTRDVGYCNNKTAPMPCERFQLSVALAFGTWFLIALSSVIMFWLLASV